MISYWLSTGIQRGGRTWSLGIRRLSQTPLVSSMQWMLKRMKRRDWTYLLSSTDMAYCDLFFIFLTQDLGWSTHDLRSGVCNGLS